MFVNLIRLFLCDDALRRSGNLRSSFSLYYSQVTYTYNNMRSKYIQCHFK